MSEDDHGKGQQQEKNNNSGFEDIFATECEKVQMSDDIDVRTSGYTRTGTPFKMVVRMHEYSF